MNTPELIERIQQRVVVIATLDGDEYIFWTRDDGLICIESLKINQAVSPDVLLSMFPDVEWTATDITIIKAEPETGHLLCPKCGSLMHAHFTVETEHIASIESGSDELVYNVDLDAFADVVLEHVSCSKCRFEVEANCFVVDRTEFDNQHPTSEWKEDNA